MIWQQIKDIFVNALVKSGIVKSKDFKFAGVKGFRPSKKPTTFAVALGLVSQAFCKYFMSLERPFQALPCLFLLYTIAYSYVVNLAKVFRNTDIIKNRNFFVDFEQNRPS